MLLLTAKTAQDRIDELGETPIARILIGLFDRKVDGGVIGNVEIENLRSSNGKHMMQSSGTFRQRRFEQRGNGGIDARQMPKGGVEDGANQSTIAFPERLVGRISMLVIQRAIERQFFVDDGGKDFCGCSTRRQAGFYRRLR